MSRPLSKHASMDGPSLRRHQSQDAVGNNGCATPKPALHRAHTIAERGTGSAGPKRPREPLSPLKRFARAKESILKTFGHICEQLTETQLFLRQASGGEEPSAVSALLERNQGIVDILKRDHMKVGGVVVGGAPMPRLHATKTCGWSQGSVKRVCLHR